MRYKTTCTRDNWSVSVTSGGGTHVLNVSRRVGDRQVPGELNGHEFPSCEEAFKAALERGYLKVYEIHNRPFRQMNIEALQRGFVFVKPKGCRGGYMQDPGHIPEGAMAFGVGGRRVH